MGAVTRGGGSNFQIKKSGRGSLIYTFLYTIETSLQQKTSVAVARPT